MTHAGILILIQFCREGYFAVNGTVVDFRIDLLRKYQLQLSQQLTQANLNHNGTLIKADLRSLYQSIVCTGDK